MGMKFDFVNYSHAYWLTLTQLFVAYKIRFMYKYFKNSSVIVYNLLIIPNMWHVSFKYNTSFFS